MSMGSRMDDASSKLLLSGVQKNNRVEYVMYRYEYFGSSEIVFAFQRSVRAKMSRDGARTILHLFFREKYCFFFVQTILNLEKKVARILRF